MAVIFKSQQIRTGTLIPRRYISIYNCGKTQKDPLPQLEFFLAKLKKVHMWIPYKLIHGIKMDEFVNSTVCFLTILNFSAEVSGESTEIFIKY